MARVWILADPCADPGIFARGVQARLPENSSDNVFFFFFVPIFYSGLSMVYFKENYNFTKFRWGGGGGGVPTFSRRVQPFPGRSNFWDANANSRNP